MATKEVTSEQLAHACNGIIPPEDCNELASMQIY